MKKRHHATPTDARHKTRLMSKVIVPNDPEACWGWTASVKETGYGRVRVDKILYIASRLSYAVHCGDPGELDVCHSCDNPICTNPRHLFLADHAANIRDAVDKGRWEHKGRGASRNVGAKNPAAKLSDDEIASIRSLYASGSYRQKDLASRFGVAQGYISVLTFRSNRRQIASPQVQ